jgi:predicted Zn finger-like uncharacterized protein
MDVRCERCRAQYVVDDARVSEAGVKVGCAQCGHAFLLRKRTLAITVPLKGEDAGAPTPIAELARPAAAAPDAGPEERSVWRLRQPGGAIFPFRELSTLQRWIVERKASRDDEVAAAGRGDDWRRLGDIPELQSFFALLEKAQRRHAANPDAAAEAQPAPPGIRPDLEDPAWASGPVPPTRRVTRSALRHPPPRRRVVWVVLLALGLLGVAAGTVYLRSKADADAAAQEAAAKVAALAAVATAKPEPPAPPPPVPERRIEPSPEPARERPPEPAPEASLAPSPATSAGASAPADPVGPPPPVATTQAEPEAAGPVDTAPAPHPAPAPVKPPPKRDDPAAVLRGLLTQARAQRDRGRCEAALDLYGKALSIDGRNATALAGRGACYLDLSRYVQAEASFEAALDADPRNSEALHGMAETYRYMGRKGDAVTYYEKFLAVRPTGDDAAAARRLISQLKE